MLPHLRLVGLELPPRCANGEYIAKYAARAESGRSPAHRRRLGSVRPVRPFVMGWGPGGGRDDGPAGPVIGQMLEPLTNIVRLEAAMGVNIQRKWRRQTRSCLRSEERRVGKECRYRWS